MLCVLNCNGNRFQSSQVDSFPQLFQVIYSSLLLQVVFFLLENISPTTSYRNCTLINCYLVLMISVSSYCQRLQMEYVEFYFHTNFCKKKRNDISSFLCDFYINVIRSMVEVEHLQIF
jgi:hypothetical protein